MRGAAYVNGTITSADTAVIPVLDHGFLFGEGVYEVLRTYNGVPFLYDKHAARLRNSARHIQLEVPFDDGALGERIAATIAKANITGEADSRILLTRGIGEITYDVRATPEPSLIIIVKTQEEPAARIRTDGIRISLVPILRNHPGSVNPIIKSTNLLNNALAMQEALRRGAEEALMCNYRGELSECSQSNFFMVRGGVVLTPASAAGLLEGVTRAFLFDVARDAGVELRAASLLPADIDSADELFITSTTREVSPVVRVDDRVIGDGRPGPITLALWDAYHRRALEITSPSQRVAAS
jgi:branched-chain amino acid aminotransferase